MGALSFVTVWNYFLFNLLLARVQNQNIQVAMTVFHGQFSTDISDVLAGTTVVMIIPAITFVVPQKYVIAGFTAGAVL